MDILDRSVARAPQTPLDPKKLPFGRTFSPNMFLVDWDEGEGLARPQDRSATGPCPWPPPPWSSTTGRRYSRG